MSLFHYRWHWRVVPLLLCLITAMMLLAATTLSAQKILFIGHLNPDCYADTVQGTRHGNELTYVPDVIVWGQPDSLSAPCDADSAASSKKNSPRRTTKIVYPEYHNMGGSASFVQFNPNDTLADIVLFLWGSKKAQGQETDTGRAVVVFGQKDLDKRPVLSIHQISRGFQSKPFFAQDLRVGEELHSPKKRDLSGITSYAIRRSAVAVGDTTSEPPPPIVTDVRDSIAMRVYPNPSLYTATIEAEVDAGAYTAQVVGVDGRVQREQEMRLEQRGLLWHNVDVATLPNGYYVVQLRRDGRVVGSYPFIIMR